MVESKGLNIRSLSVSIKVFGPVFQQNTISDSHFYLNTSQTIFKQEENRKLFETIFVTYIPAIDVPQFFSTPSTAAAMALPFSTDLSIRAIASYKHFAISRSAITSPFSTTGRCLNLPTVSNFKNYIKEINYERAKRKRKMCGF